MNESGSPKRFGTFVGVFTPSILTIIGVILYLRLGWVMGAVGLPGDLDAIAPMHLITETMATSSLFTRDSGLKSSWA